MPRIPTITSQRKLVGGVNVESAQPRGDNVFDAAALFGNKATRAARAIRDNAGRQQATAAVADFDYTKRFLERKQTAPADGAEFYNDTRTDYDDAVDQHVDKIEDDKVRQQVRDKLISRKPAQLAAAAKFEVQSRQSANRAEADNALNTVENRVRGGADFDEAVKDGAAVIDSQQLPAGVREQMKVRERQRLASAHFESRIEGARTEDDLQELENQLIDDPKWGSIMRPEDYDTTIDAIKTARKSVKAANKAAGVAAVGQLTERNADGAAIPVEELKDAEEAVTRSGDARLMSRFYGIAAKQRIIRNESGVRARDVRANMRRRDPMAGVPTKLSKAISKYANSGASSGYLATVSRIEFGVHFNGDATNFDRGNLGDTTSAHGPFQFTKKTWMQFAPEGLRTVRSPAEIARMTPEQMLALRGDVDAATAVAAHMSAKRKTRASRQLGRKISEPEQYMTHLLGVGGAVSILRAVDAGEGDMSAEAALANAIGEDRAALFAKNNPAMFKRKNGRSRTAEGFVTNIVAKFDTAPGRFAHVRQEARESLIKRQKKALADDPMAYAAETGRLPGAQEPLDFNDPETLKIRGDAARAAADYYEIPDQDMKPLTIDEAASLAKAIADGTPEDTAGILASLTALGPDMSAAAFRQIGEKDPVSAHAAGLISQAGQPETGLSVIRGRKRMKEDDGIKTAAGLGGEEGRLRMATLTQGALSRLTPRSASAAFDAAVALHVDRMALSGNLSGVLDPEEFDKSIQAVLGGEGSIDVVNSVPILLPQGVTATAMERALDEMTEEDLAKVSANGKPPIYNDPAGTPVEAEDIADEGKLRVVSKNRYQVEMGDGSVLVTDVQDNGTAIPYVMVIDRSVVEDLSEGPADARPSPPIRAPSREGFE